MRIDRQNIATEVLVVMLLTILALSRTAVSFINRGKMFGM